MTKEKMAPSMLRKIKANDCMKFGDVEPSHLPNLNVLRVAKSENLRKSRLHDDPVWALMVAKYSSEYQNYIKDIGCDRFFVHYYSATQLLVYRGYCQQNPFPKVSIDATGGLVKRLNRLSCKKSGHIFLYDITVHDKNSKLLYSVANMLSERQDNNSIYHWLSEWLRNGATPPKEVVTDMSLALLSAVVRAFAQIHSLSQYIDTCSKLLTGIENTPLPKCFIRCDIAQVIKLITKWESLRRKIFRTRQFYIRSMALIVLSTDLEDVSYLLRNIFTVALSETDGKLDNDKNTRCEISKFALKARISTGEISDLEGIIEEPDSLEKTFEEFRENTIDGKTSDDFLFFSKFSVELQEACRSYASTEEGDHDNMQYLPEIVPEIQELIKLLPLWSSVMVPIFGYGGPTASSSSVENNFNDLKHRVLSHKTLPLRLDEFVEIHIKSLEGSMKIISAKNSQAITSTKRFSSTRNENEKLEQKYISEILEVPKNGNYLPLKKRKGSSQDQVSNLITTKLSCVACAAGHYPTGAHKCKSCGIPVHIFDECSVPVKRAEEGYGQMRLCINCSGNSSLDEDNAQENWRGLADTVPKRAKRSYLETNAEFAFSDLHESSISKRIGLLRNGNASSSKGALLTTVVDKQTISITNTCSIDSLVQLLCVAYCDSISYQTFVDVRKKDIPILDLVSSIVCKGISAKTYKMRAEILLEIFPSTNMASGIKLVSAESTIVAIASKLLKDVPSFVDEEQCSEAKCPKNKNYVRNVCCIEIDSKLQATTVKKIPELVYDLLSYFHGPCSDRGWETSGNDFCNGERRLSTAISEGHILIEILNVQTPSVSTSDIVQEVCVKLDEIAPTFEIKGRVYVLRGFVGFFGGTKRLNSVGHYVAFCRRNGGSWEIYDDTTKGKVSCSRSSKQNCQFLLYTV